jgi:hypothetical protein
VVDYRPVVIATVLQRPAHDFRGAYRGAVVAVGDRPVHFHLVQVSQFLPFSPHRNTADGKNADDAFSRRDSPDVVHHVLVVQRRVGVGHTADGGETAPRRRPRPRGNGLLIFVAGLPQVAVQVDEPGADDESVGIEDGEILIGRGVVAQPLYFSFFNEEAGDFIDVPRGVDNPPSPYQQRFGHVTGVVLP